LARHGLDSQTRAFNVAGAQVARAAAGDRVAVLGDVGPLTAMLEPYGDCSEPDAAASFAQQVEALTAGGVDGFVVETMSDPTELSLAVKEAARTGLPVIATFTYSRTAGGDYRTMMGTTIRDAVAAAIDAGASVVGTNCGTSLSLEDYLQLASQLVAAAAGTPVIVQPNAGSPKTIDDRVVYDAAPADLATLVPLLLESGVRIIGGCCGTTPAHLAAMRAALDARAKT
jgi:5-methyltetrahydrofolate--homocysteine methyltransferase